MTDLPLTLYSYWRSTTSYRVRIALNLKGLAYDIVPVNLVTGEQTSAEYLRINPVGGVPSLKLADGQILTQSMAILEYLDRIAPKPALLPGDPIEAAHVRAAALVVACDIHPVNNLKVGKKLKSLGHGQDEVVDWMNDWMARGFTALQSLIAGATPFCFGDTPGLADICLVSQLYNAHRWGTNLSPFARLTAIEARCLDLPAFNAARPETQPDRT
ncbi:maleylacetoacetate isomerase [Mesorhizobium sp. Cs1299R1N3]|uniref:maleylacetoacetate isomerase n=1 Tax=Mesorhizobium sp. Cs1299R1N3 TaxID=3015173 RepID=UPI00301D84CB